MSTDIANLVLRDTDERLERLSAKYNINYTRFVDDISFSGKAIPDAFIALAKKVILQSGFQLNTDKESLIGNGATKQVTGLFVNRRKPNVPRRNRREVRKEAYLFGKYGKNQLEESIYTKRDQQIKGKLAYIDYINRHRNQ